MNNSDKTLHRFWDVPLRDLLQVLNATPAGLTTDEAKQRPRLHGPTAWWEGSRFTTPIGFLSFFADQYRGDCQCHLDWPWPNLYDRYRLRSKASRLPQMAPPDG